ncbi:lachesin [Eurytemora carolleeae]|uniref:lachesin n=1 Tax=Eurytemora carolleeae TaxID=1294199 RepID=UPI000C773372|nr:lachesin [Eurytemora carolleeae]|eukprot:XP_023346610.1 lachesin-like [Eurytemora affinis]
MSSMIGRSILLLFFSPISTSTFMAMLDPENPVDRTPRFTSVLSNVSAPTERDVMFTCNVVNLGTFNVGWVEADTKAIQAIGDQLITHNPRVSVSGDMKTTFNLHISSISREDAGQYMCQINTDPMLFQSAWLHVQVPPDIDMSRTSGDLVTREHDDTARFTCRAQGIPTPEIRWKREGGLRIRTRKDGTQRMVDEVEGYSLEIHRVRREDMGAYLCIASNDVPPAVSKRIYLHVQFPPSILPGLSLMGSSTGRDVTLECIVESYPAAFIVWSIEEKILHGEEADYSVHERGLTMYRLSSKLIIHNYSDRHSGTYRCQGTNSLGSADSTIRVYTTERREPKYEIVLEKEFTPDIIQDNQSEQFLLPEWKSFSDPTQNPEKVKPVDKTRTNMNQRSQPSHSLFSSQPSSSASNSFFLLFIVIHIMQ